MQAQNPSPATSNRTSNRTEVRRATQSGARCPFTSRRRRRRPRRRGFPGRVPGHYRAQRHPGQALVEQPRGPQLSEQLDMLSDVLADRRVADLERRGLFLHPEVF